MPGFRHAWSICAAVLVGCSQGAASEPPLPYALGVAGGDCPPDVAFFHASGSRAEAELGVVVPPEQRVSYRVSSSDGVFDGTSGEATVTVGQIGHTFALGIPMSAIDSVSVTAGGNSASRGSTCAAVPL